MTQEERKLRAVELYCEGHGLHAIASGLGTHVGYVRAWIVAAGILIRKRGRPWPRKEKL